MQVKLTSEQTKFIKSEFGYAFPSETGFELPDDKADTIFERCTDIEVSESHTDEDMSPRGEVAVSLVTMLGGH